MDSRRSGDDVLHVRQREGYRQGSKVLGISESRDVIVCHTKIAGRFVAVSGCAAAPQIMNLTRTLEAPDPVEFPSSLPSGVESALRLVANARARHHTG